MRKFFLIPLLACFSCVMAWGANVAKIGDTNYTSLNAAIEAVGENGTIQLLASEGTTAAKGSFIHVTKNFTIDGTNGTGKFSLNRHFVVDDGKKITLKNVTVKNMAVTKDSSLTTTAETFLLGNGSELVLSNASITAGIKGMTVRILDGDAATIRLKEGTSNTMTGISGSSFLYATTATSKLTFTGNGALVATAGGASNYTFGGAGKYVVDAPNAVFGTKNNAVGKLFNSTAQYNLTAGTYKYNPANRVAEDYLPMTVKEGTYAGYFKVVAKTAVAAEVNGLAYETLAEAIEAASIADEITLYADAPATTISKSLTINANGHNASAISAAAGYTRIAIDGGYAFGKVNKEGNVYTVSDFDEFLFAANYAAVNGDIIRFANDIAYTTNGKGLIDITKSLTIDGQGHTFSGYGKLDASAYPAIGVNIASQSNETELTLKDITISNPCKTAAYYCRVIQTGGHVKSLTLDNANIVAPNGSSRNARGIQIDGDDTGWDKKMAITVTNSSFNMGYSSYCITSFNPYVLNATNSKFDAWNLATMKDGMTAHPVAGSRGSVLNFDACTIQTINPHSGYSNDYEIFSIQDDGITINLNNCTTNAVQLGDQTQAVFDLNPWQLDHTRRVQPVVITISGDNSNIQGILSKNYWAQGFNSNKTPEQSDDYLPDPAFTYTITITGGTYGFHPQSYPEVVIPSGYEVKEITTQQGGLQTTLYRVRSIITTSESINDNVEEQGAGQNAHTEFLISANETVEQQSTIAYYVEVSNNATLTLPEGKKLEVTNGLDVTNGATLDVAAGSTLVVGEGGVTSENTGSIVIEANENGSASFLMDPEVVINTTPNLTVKMTVKGKGWKNESAGKTYYWHRFAAPVVMAEAWSKAPDYGTWLYGWDYNAAGGQGAWAELASSLDMVPFQGYTLSPEHEIVNENEEIVYSFKGQLAGNQNMNLQFNSRGFNFFGNSYTGYISVLTLVEQLMGNENIDGTIWMWKNDGQGYEAVSLKDLEENPGHYVAWQKEIAPMQTFILRQINTGDAVSTELNYASSVWGNPRYSSSPTPAPARRTNSEADPFVRIMITAANGQNSEMSFAENADRSDDFEKGYDAIKYMNENSINIYSTLDGQDYSNVATNDLEGKTITLQTNDEIAYTMSFPIVDGENYAIRDNATNQVINIEAGATYAFAAQPNSTIADRFEIVSRANMPTAIENTEVKANVKGIYTIMGQYLGENFDILPAGVYVVDGVKIVK